MVRKTLTVAAIAAGLVLLAGCATAPVDTDKQLGKKARGEQARQPLDLGECAYFDSGMASWYGNELLGNRTANGEMFKPDGITAAHRTLPFGTILKVIPDGFNGNPDGVIVRVNDRGPFIKGRIIDLSAGAARELRMKSTKKVKIFRCS